MVFNFNDKERAFTITHSNDKAPLPALLLLSTGQYLIKKRKALEEIGGSLANSPL